MCSFRSRRQDWATHGAWGRGSLPEAAEPFACTFDPNRTYIDLSGEFVVIHHHCRPWLLCFQTS